MAATLVILGGPGPMSAQPAAARSRPIDTTLTLVSSPNPSVKGQEVTFTATVVAKGTTATPGGSILFKEHGRRIGKATIHSGVARFRTRSLGVGRHPIVAVFPGKGKPYNPSRSFAVVQVVNRPGHGGRKAFEFPADGQHLDYEGDYSIKATAVSGATAYRMTLSQQGKVRATTAGAARSWTIPRGSPVRGQILPDVPTTLSVQARIGNRWSPARTINVFLTPRKAEVKVLEFRYFPLDGQGNLDQTETDYCCHTLESIRARTDMIAAGTEQALEESTRPVHGSPGTYLDYRKVATFERLTAIPHSKEFEPFADHFKVLESVNVCDWVDRQGVRDVWVWMYHSPVLAPIESNMAMGRSASQFFNHGSYGDVSNSFQQNDLPVCENTYTVYDFNYSRGPAEATHNYGHQRERVFGWADPDLWSRWYLPYGADQTAPRNCGDVHHPPNATGDYDYQNPNPVPSRCGDWKPDNTGQVAQVSCADWGCSDDPPLQYLIWWAQHMPGRGTTRSLDGVRLRNWHEFFADFDTAARVGRSLKE